MLAVAEQEDLSIGRKSTLTVWSTATLNGRLSCVDAQQVVIGSIRVALADLKVVLVSDWHLAVHDVSESRIHF